MDPYQFRPGNYFLKDSVAQITDAHLQLLHDGKPAKDELHPIRISEEWLLSFGFKNHKNSWRSDHASFSLEVFGRGKFFLHTPCYTLEVYWIHQLQNLYLQITGKELLKRDDPS